MRFFDGMESHILWRLVGLNRDEGGLATRDHETAEVAHTSSISVPVMSPPAIPENLRS
jgi:hypothetical protein